MDTDYYILESGKKEGPFTAQELMDRPLEPDDIIVLPLQSQGVEAHVLPEFKSYFRNEGIFYPTPVNTSLYILRLPAFIIDGVILSILVSIVSYTFFPEFIDTMQKIFIMSLNNDTKVDELLQKNQTGMLIFQAVLFVVTVVYHAFCESSRMRASVGKYIFGLAVVDELGYSLTLGHAMMRNLGKIIYELLGLINVIKILSFLAYLRIVWSYRHQGIHDQLSGCYVVKKNK